MLKTSIKKVILTSFFASFVTICTFFKIQIPIGSTSTMLHLGNVVCLLAGLILGPFCGGIAAGIGSFLFDLLNSVHFFSAPFSLIFKFIMAFSCGIIYSKINLNHFKVIAATACGSLAYTILYGAKVFITNRYIFGFCLEISLGIFGKSVIISCTNAIFSTIIASYIYSEINRKLNENLCMHKVFHK